MKLSHTSRALSARFDDPGLVGLAGLVPVMGLAEKAGLRELTDTHVHVPTDKGANPGLKVSSLVGGMVAGADSIDDMGVLRHGAMDRLFGAVYAPSTLGSFLREFTFGHVRQLDAVASRFLTGLADAAPLVSSGPGIAMVDVDDTIIEVHGYQKQGAGYGYNKKHGLNALLATLTTPSSAPVIVAQRLRKGSTGSPRGAKRLVADAVATSRRLLPVGTPVVVRADSAFYGTLTIGAALTGGAQVSVTVKLDERVRTTIGRVADDAWTMINYPHAVKDPDTGAWISQAEVAEIPYTAFTSKPAAQHVPGRLVVRRVPDVNAETHRGNGQDGLFDVWRFHAFFTTIDTATLDTVAVDKFHRHHAIIEQVNADLKGSALAHLPSGTFTANAAWLVLAVIAFNLTRAAATLSGTLLATATTATIRRKLITLPARVASSARRITLRLPRDWPWETPWTTLFTRVLGPPVAVTAP
jgi:hypothetical protein